VGFIANLQSCLVKHFCNVSFALRVVPQLQALKDSISHVPKGFIDSRNFLRLFVILDRAFNHVSVKIQVDHGIETCYLLFQCFDTDALVVLINTHVDRHVALLKQSILQSLLDSLRGGDRK
jgi:hypothetical protein